MSGRAEMFGIRDAAVVRSFRRECGILYTLNGSGKTLHEVLAVADAISPSMAGPRADQNLSRHGSVRQSFQRDGNHTWSRLPRVITM